MKLFFIIWAIVQLVLIAAGNLWLMTDWKKNKSKKPKYVLIITGSIMMLIYFLIFMPMMQ